jgi:hypothetical protein
MMEASMALELIAKREDRLIKQVKKINGKLDMIAGDTDVKDGFSDVVNKLDEILKAIKKAGGSGQGGGSPGGGKDECTQESLALYAKLQVENDPLHELFEKAQIAIFEGIVGKPGDNFDRHVEVLYGELARAADGHSPLTVSQIRDLVHCVRHQMHAKPATKSA